MTAMDKLLESVEEIDHLSVKEAAGMLGRTEVAVRNLIRDGALLVKKQDRRNWVPRSEVERLLLRAEHKAEYERLGVPGATP